MILQVENIGKSFGGAMVLDGVSFALGQGCIKGLIGPNGAGKTTLFNVMTGMVTPDAGRVVFAGSRGECRLDRMKSYQIARSGVARTFQKPSLAWHLTVFENVLLGAMNNRRAGLATSRSRLRAWTEECLERCRIPRNLWQMESSRVGIAAIKAIELARAVALSPEVILCDEICSGLAHAETDELLGLIAGFNARERCSFIFVEHDLRAVQSLCPDVIVLDFGRVIFDGAIGEAFADRRVIEAYMGENDA
jgi:branched-chain amino acid transport system ATP-binding protein